MCPLAAGAQKKPGLDRVKRYVERGPAVILLGVYFMSPGWAQPADILGVLSPLLHVFNGTLNEGLHARTRYKVDILMCSSISRF